MEGAPLDHSLICFFCKQKFTRPANLSSHYKTKHSVQEESARQKCPDASCPKTYGSISALNKHIRDEKDKGTHIGVEPVIKYARKSNSRKMYIAKKNISKLAEQSKNESTVDSSFTASILNFEQVFFQYCVLRDSESMDEMQHHEASTMGKEDSMVADTSMHHSDYDDEDDSFRQIISEMRQKKKTTDCQQTPQLLTHSTSSSPTPVSLSKNVNVNASTNNSALQAKEKELKDLFNINFNGRT